MVTITAPGVEIKEIDLSFYDFPPPKEETQNVFIMGFASKGYNNIPYTFTHDNSEDDLRETFGVPTNEAERYFFNACAEAIKREKVVVYAARLPYYNTATNNYNGIEYYLDGLDSMKDLSSVFAPVISADSTLASGIYLKVKSKGTVSIAADSIEDYRTQAVRPEKNHFIILDKKQEIYKKIPIDAKHMTKDSRYLLGVLPVVTTAANAMYFQDLIATDLPEHNISCFEPLGDVSSSTSQLTPDLMVNPSNSQALDENNKGAMTLSKFASSFFPTINMMPDGSFDRDRLRNIGVVVFKGYIDSEAGNKVKYEPVEAFAGSLKSDDVDPTTGVSRFIDDIINTNSETIEFYSNCFNGIISNVATDPEIVNDLVATARTLNNVFENYILTADVRDDFSSSNLNDFAEYIDNVIMPAYEARKEDAYNEQENRGYKNNSERRTILNTIKSLKQQILEILDKTVDFTDIDILYTSAEDQPGHILGFKELDAEEKQISFGQVLGSIDKIFEKAKNIDDKQIDIVVDAGVSNIVQFMYTVNGKMDINLIEKADDDNPVPASIWLKNYDPLAFQERQEATDDEPAKPQRSAVALWDVCTRVPGSTASVPLDGATDQWQLVLQKYDNFCKKVRKDCMFVADGLRPFCIKGNRKIVTPTNFNSTVKKSILPFVKYISGKVDTSYGAGYCDWYRITDPTSGVNMWMPPSIKAMCVMLDTTNNYYYWTAPAGPNYGKLNPVDPVSKVVVNDIAFSPTVEEAGGIYTKSWNYMTYHRDDGFILEGQRTFQTRPTAFDRINVRRLFLYLERKVYSAARYFVYEGNTAYTRQRLIDTIEPYFKNAKALGGINDYRLQCDEKNNTSDTIDRNELHVKIAIKPTKAIEFIECTFYALRTGGSFTEVGMED